MRNTSTFVLLAMVLTNVMGDEQAVGTLLFNTSLDGVLVYTDRIQATVPLIVRPFSTDNLEPPAHTKKNKERLRFLEYKKQAPELVQQAIVGALGDLGIFPEVLASSAEFEAEGGLLPQETHILEGLVTKIEPGAQNVETEVCVAGRIRQMDGVRLLFFRNCHFVGGLSPGAVGPKAFRRDIKIIARDLAKFLKGWSKGKYEHWKFRGKGSPGTILDETMLLGDANR